MDHTLTTIIEKCMHWRGGSWVRFDQKGPYVLRIIYDQLLISVDSRIIESLNINGKIKGFFKNDVLILILSSGNEVRKIKFVIKDNVSECLELLGRHFPVVSHGALSKNAIAKYRDLDEVLQGAFEAMGQNSHSLPVPANLRDFMKLCLLDPMFPQLVHETQNILENDFLKK